MQGYGHVRVLVVVALLVALAGGLIGKAFAQAQERPPVAGVALDEKTYIGLGLVALLLASASSYGAAWMQIRSHIGNQDIHHTSGHLMRNYVPGEQCASRHREERELLREVLVCLKKTMDNLEKALARRE